MNYLGWFDGSAKHTTEQKIAGAIAAYRERFGYAPNVILLNEADAPAAPKVAGVAWRTEKFVRWNNFWLGGGVE